MLVTTSVTPSILVPQNRLRKSILIQNNDASISVYVKRERGNTATVSASDYDFRVGPGAAIAVNSVVDGLEAIQDRYTVVAVSGAPVIAVFETEDVRR